MPLPQRNAFRRLLERQEPETWLQATMDDYFDQLPDDSRIDPGWFHPSSMSIVCDFCLACSFLGVRPTRKVEAKLRRIFDTGKDIGRRWQGYLKGAGLHGEDRSFYRAEKRWQDNDLRMRGSSDDVIVAAGAGFQRAGIEIKSMNEFVFNKLSAPKPDHVFQVQSYFMISPLDAFWYVYVCKNCPDYKTFLDKPDPDKMFEIRQRTIRVRKQLADGQMPEGRMSPDCHYLMLHGADIHLVNGVLINAQGERLNARSRGLNRIPQH